MFAPVTEGVALGWNLRNTFGVPDQNMNTNLLVKEIIDTYRRHGWQLRRVLIRPETHRESFTGETMMDGISIEEAEIDALWFSRPSHNKREAWELRQLSESPYALFETFEADETEDLRAEARMEMENRMKDRR